MWSLNLQAALFAVIVALTTALAVLLRSRKPLHMSYAAFALSTGLFYFITVLEYIFYDFPIASNFTIVTAAISLIAAASFFDVLLGEAGVKARTRRRKTHIIGLVIMTVGMTPLVDTNWIKFPVFVVMMFLFWIRVKIVLERAKEVKSQAEQIRLRYLAYAGAITLVLISFDFSSRLSLPLPPIGGVVVAIYLYFIFQALLASRLLDLHELLGKALVFASLTILLAALYAIMAKKGQLNSAFLFHVILASSIVLILFDPLRQYLEEKTTRFFYREYLSFAEDMRAACRILAGFVELKTAIEFVIDQIYDNKRATHVAIYLLDFDKTSFSAQGYRGPAPVFVIDGKKHPVLFRYIMEHNRPIHINQIIARESTLDSPLATTLRKLIKESQPNKETHFLLQDLKELNFDIVVPLRYGSSCVGILTLADKRLPDAFSSDEIAALSELGDQLSITIQNSHLFAELRERDRLAAIGEMSAGLAHEIRNPLAAIKGAAQTLDPQHFSGEDAELFHIIIDEVNRLNKVVSEFLDYSKPYRGVFSTIDLNALVQRTFRLLEHDIGRNIDVTCDLEDSLPEISGDIERLSQVLINLVLNAKEAIGEKGAIRISTRSVSPGHFALQFDNKPKKTHVELRIQDTGIGIPTKIRDKLFIPFFTTKIKGTGLGLATCQRIIREHGGDIDFRSLVSKGTTFIVKLPTTMTHITSKHQTSINYEGHHELRI